MSLHPKIKYASLAAICVALVTIANTVAEVYPTGALTTILSVVIPVLVGYQKASSA